MSQILRRFSGGKTCKFRFVRFVHVGLDGPNNWLDDSWVESVGWVAELNGIRKRKTAWTHLRDLAGQLMIRLVVMFAFSALFLLASDCQAQRHRFFAKRGERVRHHSPHHSTRYQAPNLQQQLDGTPTHHRSRLVNMLFPPAPSSSRYWDDHPVHPKYFGGFHSSHLYNLGVPSGDIGFRGNGVYWNPW